ncbi:13269_t:CDS:2 [Ambispora leptoticha]|uniref:13269_t:CDS:1 n=1 Tax=Ambispora leptoticha TaxID=144679 RepID=A0A9N9GEN5_9GLOM|nr:13269_t:CDS:2 [Ambispora leptoticha]
MREKLKNKDESLDTFPGPLILERAKVGGASQANIAVLVNSKRDLKEEVKLVNTLCWSELWV